jgi:Domain of unknown function (DUF4349)
MTQGVAMFRDHPLRRSPGPVVAVALTALAIAACSAGQGSTSSAPGKADSAMSGRAVSGGAVSGGAVPSPASGAPQAATGASSTGGISVAALQASQSQLARRATIAMQVKNIGQAVAQVRAATAAVNGIVLVENIGAGGGVAPLDDPSKVTATTYAEITVSVPSTELDSTIDDLSKLGVVIRSQSSSEDVGSQLVDTDSRRKTMQASVDRVRALMGHATDIGQIVALESELSRREADLEALESQLAALKDSVAHSPIQISLTTVPGAIAKATPATGFLAGLKNGRNAFTGSVQVILTVVGAVLPFAILLALVLLPVWWQLRRRRATATPASAPPTVLAG